MTFLTVPFLQRLPSLTRKIPSNINLLSVHSEEQPIGPVQPQFKALKKALSSETFNSVLIWLSFLTKYFICLSLLRTSTQHPAQLHADTVSRLKFLLSFQSSPFAQLLLLLKLLRRTFLLIFFNRVFRLPQNFSSNSRCGKSFINWVTRLAEAVPILRPFGRSCSLFTQCFE